MAANNGPQLRGRIGIDGEKEYKAALNDARKTMQLVNSELELLSAQFDANGASLENYQQKQDALTRKLAAQRTQVSTMEDVLEAVKREYGDNSEQAAKYGAMLNKTRAAMIATEKELRKNERAMEELAQEQEGVTEGSGEMEQGAQKAGRAVQDQGSKAADAADKHQILGSAAKAAGALLKGAVVAGCTAVAASLAAVSAAAIKAGVDLTNIGTEYTQATNKLSAQTGATGTELEKLSAIAQSVYASGLGESIGEVNEALAVTRTNTKLVGEELQQATTAGFYLRDTFGFEFQESSRAANSLMQIFGLSAQEAYNLIAIGAQQGANQNGDMLDVLSEYAPMFESMGMSADQMMQALINGSESGAFSIDKVGDAMKEFSLRCMDGSESTKQAFATIHLDADAMAAQFAMGGDNARHAFATTVEAILSIEDPLLRSQTAVQLFGTQFEDLGPDVLQVLADMANSGELTADALSQIAAVRYDDLNNSIEGFRRKVEMELQPVAQQFSGLAKEVFDAANDAMTDGFQPEDVRAIGEALAAALVEGIGTLETLIAGAEPMLSTVVSTIGSTVTTLLPTLIGTLLPAATGLLQSVVDGVVANIGPLTQLATDIVTSVATFITENAAPMLGAAADLITGLADGVAAALPQLLPAALSMVSQLVTGIGDNAGSLLGSATEIVTQLANGIGEALPTLLPAAADAVLEVVTGIGENLPSLVAAGYDLITNLVQGIGEAIPQIAEKLPEVIGGITSAVTENLPQIVTSGGEILGSMIGGIVNAIPDIATGLVDVVAAIGSAFLEIDWLELGKNFLDGLYNGLESALGSSLESIKGVFSRIWDGIKAVFGINSPSTVAAEAGGFILEGLLEGFRAAVDGVVTQVKEIFGKIWDAIKSIFGFGSGESEESKEAKAAGQDIMTGMQAGITGSEDGVKEAARKAAQAALDAIHKVLGTSSGDSTVAKTIGSDLLDGLENGLADIGGTAFASAASAVYKAFSDAINTAFGVESTGFLGTGEKVASKFVALGEQICKALADGISSNNDNAEAVRNAVTGVANAAYEQAITEISGGLTGSTETVNAAVQAVVTQVYDAAAEILAEDQGGQIGSGFAEGIAGGMRSGIGSVRSAASDLGGQALSALWGQIGQGGSKFAAIGKAITDGVAGGIRNGSGTIVTAAQNAARAAYDAICAELEIHSPSRKAHRAGLYTGGGFAAGLEDSRERITAAATVMSRAVYAPMTAAQPQTLAIDYDKLGESVARANRAAGIGTAVLDVDGRRMSRQLEPGVMHAGQLRSRQSVSGRSSRMVTVR